MPKDLSGLTTPSSATPPPLPGSGHQPSAEYVQRIEDQWASMVNIQRGLAEIMETINRHPEVIEWAKQSVSGTFKPKP